MSNLAETLSQVTTIGTLASMRNNRRTAKELSISAASAVRWIKSEHFILCRVEVAKLPIVPSDLMAEAEDYRGVAPIVDVNVQKVGRLSNGYTPKIVLLAGADLVKRAKANRSVYCNVWVGDKAIRALQIQADHAVGANELLRDLQEVLQEKYQVKNDPSSFAYVVEAYPYENYAIFNYKGKLLKQPYKIDPVNRKIAFIGSPVEVFTSYLDKAEVDERATEAGIDSCASYSMGGPARKMNPAEGGFISRPQLTPPDAVNYGAQNSELNIGLTLMSNVEEALEMYLAALANGQWKPVSSQYAPIPASYVPAVKEAQIAGSAVKNFAPMDFIKWQQLQMGMHKKLKDGLSASAFAYVGDKDDPSTWFLKCATMSDCKNSLKAVGFESGVPKFRKPEVKAKLILRQQELKGIN